MKLVYFHLSELLYRVQLYQKGKEIGYPGPDLTTNGGLIFLIVLWLVLVSFIKSVYQLYLYRTS